jgi:hypothetical protein
MLKQNKLSLIKEIQAVAEVDNMDFHALQKKLFDIEPTSRADDKAKMMAALQGGQLQESVEVPQGSMPIDKNYSVSDFAALAGVTLTEGQKMGSAGQAKGKDPMPKMSKPTAGSETPHPLKDKLVGEAEEDRITALERRIEALEAMLQERPLSKGEEKEKERVVKGMKKVKSDFKDRYGDDAEAVMYATATKLAKKKESTESIKERLWAKLNAKK